MGVVADALGAAIDGWRPRRPPEPARPTSIDDAADLFGPHANRDIAERYGVSIRTVQRWRAYERGDGRQARKPPPEVRRAILATARRRQLAAWRSASGQRSPGDAVARIRRHGLSMRIRGSIIVSRPPARIHTMPAEPGPPQYVPPELVDDVMDAWQRGEHELAGDELLVQSFFIAYGLPDTELTTIDWARVDIR